jgi:hypothetical protein
MVKPLIPLPDELAEPVLKCMDSGSLSINGVFTWLRTAADSYGTQKDKQ